MKRPACLVVAVLAVQAMLTGVYWLVEHGRVPERAEHRSLGTEPPQRVDLAVPQLDVRKRDGSRVDLRAPLRPTLVHFWATWCPPCRAELPGLLALPDEHSVDVMAVALDDDWADVERFLDGLPMSGVLLGEASEAERVLGVRTLPVTFLVQPNGRISLRFDGARDWTDVAFLQALASRLPMRSSRRRTPRRSSRLRSAPAGGTYAPRPRPGG